VYYKNAVEVVFHSHILILLFGIYFLKNLGHKTKYQTCNYLIFEGNKITHSR